MNRYQADRRAFIVTLGDREFELPQLDASARAAWDARHAALIATVLTKRGWGNPPGHRHELQQALLEYDSSGTLSDDWLREHASDEQVYLATLTISHAAADRHG